MTMSFSELEVVDTVPAHEDLRFISVEVAQSLSITKDSV